LPTPTPLEPLLKILYVATNFTALSHTFITREINALRERGETVALLSIRTPTILVSVALMLRDLPSWREMVPVRGNGFTLDRPVYMLPDEEGPVWSFLFLGIQRMLKQRSISFSYTHQLFI